MDDFAKLKPEERRIYFEGTATARNIQAQIVEKDFWVCWTLQELFRLPTMGGHLIFKGGTSLSKVFKIIERFSELWKAFHNSERRCLCKAVRWRDGVFEGDWGVETGVSLA